MPKKKKLEETQQEVSVEEYQPELEKPKKSKKVKKVDVDKVDEEAIKNALDDEDKDENKDEELPKESPTEAVQRARRLLQYAKNARRKYDKEWLSRDLFRRGYQFVHTGKSGSVSMTSSANSRIPVNLTWAFARSIKNQITSFNPKWDVLPEHKGRKSESIARLAGKTLDSIFKVNNMNKLIKDAVTQGLFFSNGGPFELYWDEDFDNGKDQPKGEVRIRLHDPYDVFFDPNGIDTEDCGFIIKAVRTDLDRIMSDPRYKDQVKGLELGGTLKRAESEYKQFLLQTIQDSQQQTEDNRGTILYEMHEKIYKEGDVKVRVLTWIDELDTPLRDEVIDQEYYDLEIFQADSNPLEMYGESWSKHVIALNRATNALESSIFDYHYKFAKGRLVIDKNSGVNQVTNEHGSIIEKNRGATVTDLPISPLPGSYETQLNRFYSKMEDIAGTHEASLGRVPASVKSGIGIAELKQSDASNQDDLVQNLEQCLMSLGVKILKKVAKNYTTPRIKKVVGTGRLVEHFAVVGEEFAPSDKEKWAIGEDKYPLAKIAYNNELSVNIGSWLAYTREGRQQVLMDMAQAGIIDKETVLKYFEFPDIQDIVDKTRTESLIEAKRKEEPGVPSGISQEQLANAENEMLMEGSPVPVDPETDDHELHIAIHNQILDEDNAPVVLGHIEEHRRSQKGGGKTMDTVQPAGGLTPQPQLPPPMSGGMPMNTGMPGEMAQPTQMMPMPDPTQLPLEPRPPLSYYSAGTPEIPPTASAILGGTTNQLPIT